MKNHRIIKSINVTQRWYALVAIDTWKVSERTDRVSLNHIHFHA